MEIDRGCAKFLTKNIWRSSIPQSIKLQQYNTYVLPVLLYGFVMWDLTVQSSRRLDAFDQWSFRHILRVTLSARVTNHEIRRRSIGLTACHSDNEDQAVEAVRLHRSLRPRWGPCSRSQPGPDLACGRPGASWWKASAQLLHNKRHLNNTSPQTSWLLARRNLLAREIYLTIQRC